MSDIVLRDLSGMADFFKAKPCKLQSGGKTTLPTPPI